jgi:precorrin-6B methylase 1
VPSKHLLNHLSPLAQLVVALLHGVSPFKIWQLDRCIDSLNRRSTFINEGDILVYGVERAEKHSANDTIENYI